MFSEQHAGRSLRVPTSRVATVAKKRSLPTCPGSTPAHAPLGASFPTPVVLLNFTPRYHEPSLHRLLAECPAQSCLVFRDCLSIVGSRSFARPRGGAPGPQLGWHLEVLSLAVHLNFNCFWAHCFPLFLAALTSSTRHVDHTLFWSCPRSKTRTHTTFSCSSHVLDTATKLLHLACGRVEPRTIWRLETCLSRAIAAPEFLSISDGHNC